MSRRKIFLRVHNAACGSNWVWGGPDKEPPISGSDPRHAMFSLSEELCQSNTPIHRPGIRDHCESRSEVFWGSDSR
jgi:hypothetical protein